MLEKPEDKRFFGNTKLDGMKGWSEAHHDRRKDFKANDLAYYDAWVERVSDWLATKPTGPPKKEPKTEEEKKFKEGYDAFFDKKIKQGRCSSCHSYEGDGSKQAPDLTGYGSPEWISLMIVAPGHKLRHGDANAMPAFRSLDSPGAEAMQRLLVDAGAGEKFSPLSDVDRELIIRFMLRDDRVVFFGQPVSGPPPKNKK
jgi:mono/diheme cytochrome c family protein